MNKTKISMLVIIGLVLTTIPILAQNEESSDSTSENIREYILFSQSQSPGNSLNDEAKFVVTPITVGDVNKSASKTHIELFLSANSGDSDSTSTLGTGWFLGISGISSFTNCTIDKLKFRIPAGATAGAGGSGSHKLSCDFDSYRDTEFTITSRIEELSNIGDNPIVGVRVWQTEIFNQTASVGEVTLASQTITLEPLTALVPFILLAFFIILAEWKKDAIYFFLSALLTIFVTINLPEPFPEYTRVFLVALILYLGLRTYLEFRESRFSPDVDHDEDLDL